jgi:hypothetical protein
MRSRSLARLDRANAHVALIAPKDTATPDPTLPLERQCADPARRFAAMRAAGCV